MIDHEWRAEVTGDLRGELGRLLTEAALEDAEAGFPSFSLDDEVPEGTRYLLVWLQPDERSGRDEPPPTLAGCLRLEPANAGPHASSRRAEVRLVIHPDLRSRGISTALCEQVGLQVGAVDGWAATGYQHLHCWARGDHPAAQRMSLRFSHAGLRRGRREWRLLALLRKPAAVTTRTADAAPTDPPTVGVRSAEAGTPGLDRLWRDAGRRGPAPRDGRVLVTGPAEAPDGAVWFDAGAGEPTEFGPAGVIRAVLVDTTRPHEGLVAALLDGAMAALQADGVRVAAITVADHEEDLLTACRVAGFQHDRTDCEYVLG